jgi:hypothetical protein
MKTTCGNHRRMVEANTSSCRRMVEASSCRRMVEASSCRRMVEASSCRRTVEDINHRRTGEDINHRRTEEDINHHRTEEDITRRRTGEDRRTEGDIIHHLEVAFIMEVPRLHRRQPTSLRKQLDYMRLTLVELGTVCTVIPMFG